MSTKIIFKRDIYNEMLHWKSLCVTGKTALEIKGARQIGKTYIIQKFCRENFANIFEINLKESSDRARLINLFGEGFLGHEIGKTHDTDDAENIVRKIFPKFIDSSSTVLFFDEIQDSVFLYNLIRPINRKLRCHLIVSGSFLGHTLNKSFFVPMGDLFTLTMRSMSFPEVLGAMGLRDIYESVNLYGDSDSSLYAELKNALKFYLRVGGHPKIVEQALITRDLKVVDYMLNEIINLFCKESLAYNHDISANAQIKQYLVGVAELLLRDSGRNSNYIKELGSIVGDTNSRSVKKALSWFEASGIIEACHRFNDGNPLNRTDNCRFYFSDHGVARTLYAQTLVATTNLFGSMCEGFAYACIRDMKSPVQERPHFSTYGDGELDFLFFVRSDGKLQGVGVEVKRGRSIGSTARKMLDKGIISHLVNAKGDTIGGVKDNVYTVPLALLGRFNIFDFIPDDNTLEDEDFFEGLHWLNKA